MLTINNLIRNNSILQLFIECISLQQIILYLFLQANMGVYQAIHSLLLK